MGCSGSSTMTTTNPITGETKTKHTMGGAFPGNRRQVQQPYKPPVSQFDGNGKAVSHFVSYGGGNALVLKQGPGPAKPQAGAMVATAKPPEYIKVVLPAGVTAGQTIRVAAPDGRLNEIVVPQGMGPGSAFTVEFADADDAPRPAKSGYGPPASSSYTRPSFGDAAPAVTTTATPLPPPAANPGNDADDGFATGFGGDYSSYPTASDARPVYR